MWASAIQQCELAITVPIFPSSWTMPYPSPHPTILGVTEFWVKQELPAISFTYGQVYVSMLLSPFVLPSPSPAISTVCSILLLLYSCPTNRFIPTFFLDSIYVCVCVKEVVVHVCKEIFSSVQFSHSVVSDSLRPHESQHSRPPCPSPTPGVHPKPWPLSRWCHPTIPSCVIPFFCPQSFPALGSFPVSQLFSWGAQSIGVSAWCYQSFQWTPRTDLL